MTNKTLIALVAVVMVFTLAGCGKKEAQTDQEQKQAAPKTLSDWMRSKNGVQCAVKSVEGDVTIKVKDEKIRMDGIQYASTTQAESDGHSIFDGDMVYIWAEKEGMKFNIKEMEAWSKEQPNASDTFKAEDFSWEEWASEAEKDGYEFDCDDARIDNSEFTVPQDVVFTDMLELLKGLQSMFEGADAGVTGQ